MRETRYLTIRLILIYERNENERSCKLRDRIGEDGRQQIFNGNIGIVFSGNAIFHQNIQPDIRKMEIEDLKGLKIYTSTMAWRALKDLLVSPSFWFLPIGFFLVLYLFITFNTFVLFSEYLEATILGVILFFISAYMFRRRIDQYSALADLYKKDLRLINSAIKHKNLGG